MEIANDVFWSSALFALSLVLAPVWNQVVPEDEMEHTVGECEYSTLIYIYIYIYIISTGVWFLGVSFLEKKV